jgi:hypothetical protein
VIVSYLAVERGHWVLPGGVEVEAGSVETDHTLPGPQPFVPVTFIQAFSTPPVIFSVVGTFRGSDTVATRLRNMSTAGFEVIMQEQEDRGGHLPEVIYWIAWGYGSNLGRGRVNDRIPYEVGWKLGVNQEFTPIEFAAPLFWPCLLAEMQSFRDGDPANLRYQNLRSTGVEVRVVEEQSKDAEVEHALEVVGYLGLDCAGNQTLPSAEELRQ